MGIFFLVLSLIFALAARGGGSVTPPQGSLLRRLRLRVAVIFALVGLGLILWRFGVASFVTNH